MKKYIIIAVIAVVAIAAYFAYKRGMFSGSNPFDMSGPDYNATPQDWFTETDIKNHINFLKFDARGQTWLNNIKAQAATHNQPLEAELRYRTVAHLRTNKPK